MIPFVSACKRYFGQKEGQDLKSFAEEVKLLTDQDKLDMIPELEAAIGEKVAMPTPTPPPK